MMHNSVHCIFPVLDFWSRPPPPPIIFVPLSPSLAAALGPLSSRSNLTHWNKGMGVQNWREGGTRNPILRLSPVHYGHSMFNWLNVLNVISLLRSAGWQFLPRYELWENFICLMCFILQPLMYSVHLPLMTYGLCTWKDLGNSFKSEFI